MIGIILAAGHATRLYPLTKNFPKPLLEVEGRSIIDRLADDIFGTDCVDSCIVVTNHKFAGHFEKWANDRDPARITVVDDGTETNETRLGAVRDIQFALEAAGVRDDLFVMAGDNVLDFSLRGFADFAAQVQTSCVMYFEEDSLEKLQRTAVITMDEDSLITSYEEKPQVPKSSFAVPPFYIYRRGDAARIGEALADGCSADAPGSFAAWLSARVPVHAYRMPGKRRDIGSLAALRGEE